MTKTIIIPAITDTTVVVVGIITIETIGTTEKIGAMIDPIAVDVTEDVNLI